MTSFDDEIAKFYTEKFTSKEAAEQQIMEIAIILKDNFLPTASTCHFGGFIEDDPEYLVSSAIKIWSVANNGVDIQVDVDSIVEYVRDQIAAGESLEWHLAPLPSSGSKP